MTTYDLFAYGVYTHIQENTITGETEKDTIRELFDTQALVYSDKTAKTVIAKLNPMYINEADQSDLAKYAFGDRLHIIPKYNNKGLVVEFVNPTGGINLCLAVVEPGINIVQLFNRHRGSFLAGRGVLGRNSLAFWK